MHSTGLIRQVYYRPNFHLTCACYTREAASGTLTYAPYGTISDAAFLTMFQRQQMHDDIAAADERCVFVSAVLYDFALTFCTCSQKRAKFS
jgi:hypothetical protein